MDNAIIARDSVFGFTLQLPGLPPIWYGCELAAARWAVKLGYSVKYNWE